MRSISVCLSSSCHLSVLLALLSFAFLGCVPDEQDHVFDVTYNPCEPLVIEATHELRPGEIEVIDGAVAMWNQAAAMRLSREPVAGAEHIPVRFEKGAAFVHGYYSDETGEVIINRNLTDKRERIITLAHELGHAFGLRHIARKKRRSLMNTANLETEVTEQDVERLRERWQGCPEPR